MAPACCCWQWLQVAVQMRLCGPADQEESLGSDCVITWPSWPAALRVVAFLRLTHAAFADGQARLTCCFAVRQLVSGVAFPGAENGHVRPVLKLARIPL